LEIYPSVAAVAYHNFGSFAKDLEKLDVHWLESAVLVKDKEGWKIRLLHSTKVKKKQL
jgi:hypothetical protein